MKYMNKLAIGVLAVLFSVGLVAADTFPVGGQPGNIEPKIYLVDKFFDWGLDDTLLGGSTPDGFDLQLDGSVTPYWFLRKNEYAFTGEQVDELIIARDLNGAADLSYAKVTVDTFTEALCTELPVKICMSPRGCGPLDTIKKGEKYVELQGDP